VGPGVHPGGRLTRAAILPLLRHLPLQSLRPVTSSALPLLPAAMSRSLARCLLRRTMCVCVLTCGRCVMV
jgi:hypothetical protein